MKSTPHKQFLRSFIGTLIVGLFTGFQIVSDWRFISASKTGEAEVIGNGNNGGLVITPGRSGRIIVDVTHVVDGRQSLATLRAWYCHLEPHQLVNVRYLPGNPEEVIPDRFWQLHYASVAWLLIFGNVAHFEASRHRARRRRHSSLSRTSALFSPPDGPL